MYLSFKIEEGKDLVIPAIEIVPIKEENGSSYMTKDGHLVVKMIIHGKNIDNLVFGDWVLEKEFVDEN